MNELFLTPHFKNNLKYLSNNQIVGLTPKRTLKKFVCASSFIMFIMFILKYVFECF
ncbi:hypothetical protein HPHPH4_0919 [Helicobacter pylori Hp H-4]|nr:hypothetical protein HPHPH4_0919 [Helicobacter pylori Hp H-4]EJC57050.1 hypothetical protein HPHPP3B_1034 [Helicobacter pylori Hp P-3b]